MTREELEKMEMKPWEIGYEMSRQNGDILDYKTVSFSDEDENGIRHIEMKVTLKGTVTSMVFDGILFGQE